MLDRGPARITQPEHAGHLVECLACRIVDSRTEEFERKRRAAEVKAAVPAAGDQADTRKHVLSAGQPASVDVGLKVIDGNQGQPAGRANRFGGDQTDQERAGQAGRVGDGHGIKIAESNPCPAERLVNDREDLLDVSA